MTVLTESLLVIDDGRKFDSDCVNALSSLGYRNIAHSSFEDVKRLALSSRFDALVMFWKNDLLAQAVAGIVRSVMKQCGCDGALMISSFCTSTNVELFRAAGICAWVTVPFTRRDLDARLRYALEGERRSRRVPVPVDRRRRAPMPAFA